MKLAETTAPDRQSFLPVQPESHFPIQNLPFGVFRRSPHEPARCGVAIGEHIVDLAVLERERLLPAVSETSVFDQASLNRFAALGQSAWRQVRCALSQLLDAGEPTLRDNQPLRREAIVSHNDAEMLLPMEIGDYTDFYASKEHATNVGTMFRGPDQALMPNWLHLPVGYHGRASSVQVGPSRLVRPQGQRLVDGGELPQFGPSRALDFEAEMGFFVGPGNELGSTIPIASAEAHIFGMVLVNDWSARDIQRWEYVPLGPFLGKSFCTTISPWVVQLDALEPFRCDGPIQDPAPLPYLGKALRQSFDIDIQVNLTTPQQTEPHLLAQTNFRYLYWSMAQQLTHHASNGCNMRTGDLLASGTISGPQPDSYGSLLELAWNRERPVLLPSGETRAMLQDGDTLALTGWAQGDGYRIGFGTAAGEILPAAN